MSSAILIWVLALHITRWLMAIFFESISILNNTHVMLSEVKEIFDASENVLKNITSQRQNEYLWTMIDSVYLMLFISYVTFSFQISGRHLTLIRRPKNFKLISHFRIIIIRNFALDTFLSTKGKNWKFRVTQEYECKSIIYINTIKYKKYIEGRFRNNPEMFESGSISDTNLLLSNKRTINPLLF